MGCCPSEEEAHNQRVAKKLGEYQKKELDVIKVLFLGTGESGKSTIFKQMQILAGEEFQDHERDNFRIIIRRNMVSTMQEILDEAGDTIEKNLGSSAEIVEEADDLEDAWSDQLSGAIERLWTESKVVRDIFFFRDKLHFPDTVADFFEQIKRISAPDYVPTKNDILRARNRTTGINEKKLVIRNIRFTFTDVGGQRNERRKWIHCFDGVTAVMFVVAISEYNQVLYEDEKVSRMKEALLEFKRIVNNESFARAGMILFLNKIDLLKEKLNYFSFKHKFGYQGEGGAKDIDNVKKYIQNLFLSQVEDDKPVYSFFTCGLDTENIDRVFRSCQKSVLTINLQNVGFLP
mmetsp:Transcript_22603/g.31632  ORF Transcript_22603/g.31632 Transcript_22603/m.31632 type:complete len:347 (-) Transcript_22603:221-1261(-)|eukprot:CAMPEP_0185269764 /NCGR_PEP_ID=MMETSP1359-20130426/40711_1 /TAXON_ID=552665 /ORGANISM="Bigelowiella longifila, Strain CCMP242" /LENGTH=346 /DNA_ID=CAMNT_0027861081 /DNA_START=80 /DNA_END=1120 /DNA_ORIENTATION=-